MTQYQQMQAVVTFLADTYGIGAGNLTPADLSNFFASGEFGSLGTVNDYEAFASEYDLDALAEFWNDGITWSFYDMSGLFN